MYTKQPCVYILTNKRNGTLYVGVTSNVAQRIYQHHTRLVDGFTKQYHLHVLVWYETHPDMQSAIAREKQIKGGSRKKKLALIESMNPRWQDLFSEL